MAKRGEPSSEIEPAIDDLYRAPLAEFTDRRSALAAERKAGGDKAGAARVKALVKPSVAAWAANQVYWRNRSLYDAVAKAMAEVGATQREAVAGEGAAGLREAMRR